MRRLTRVVAIAAGLLAVACLVAGRVPRAMLLSREGTGLTEVWLDEGHVGVSWKPRVPYRPRWAGQYNRFGFRYNVYSNGSGYAWGPLWALAAGSGAVACITGWVGWHPRRRVGHGRCARCGYDLQGNVSGVCPECGQRAT